MLTRYKAMIAMRREHAVLRTGECSFIAPCGDVLGVIQHNSKRTGCDFGKKADNALAVTLHNRSARDVTVYLTKDDVGGAKMLKTDSGETLTAARARSA